MRLFRGNKKKDKKNNNGPRGNALKSEKKVKAWKVRKSDSEKTGTVGAIATSKSSENLKAWRFLIRPHITEKSHNSMDFEKYVFEISRDANKKKVKNALESLYGVKVVKVNIINIPSKKRNFGKIAGIKSGYKKAIVTLKKGDKIELFKGV